SGHSRHTKTCVDPAGNGLWSGTAEVIVIMQCYECLARQIHERGGKKAKGEDKKSPTPDSCGTFKDAVTKATMTSIDVMMALIIAKRIDLFSSTARRLWRGISDFNCALPGLSSPISFNACNLTMILFIREISTDTNAATAPRRNAGAVTWPMT